MSGFCGRLVLAHAAFIVLAQYSSAHSEDFGSAFVAAVQLTPSKTFWIPKEEFYLQCEVGAGSADGIRWLRDDAPISLQSTSYRIIKNRLFIQPVLDLPAQRRLEGAYSCAVELEGKGMILSSVVDVRYPYTQPFQRRRDMEVKALQDSTTFIDCGPPNSVPPALLYVEMNGTRLPLGLNSDHYLMTLQGLQIRSINDSDAGSYVCVAENPASGDIQRSAAIRLVVEDRALVPVPATMVYPNVRQIQRTTAVGESITLECVVTGNPKPVVRWERDHGELTPEKFSYVWDNLIVHNVTEAEADDYVCRAVSRAAPYVSGTANQLQQQYAVYKLQVTTPVNVTVNVVPSNDVVQLQCRASISAELKWFFNGKDLLSSGIRTRNMDFRGDQQPYWTVNLVKPVRQGIYQCVARAPHSQHSASVFLPSREYGRTTTIEMRMRTFPMTTTTEWAATQPVPDESFLPRLMTAPENRTETVGGQAVMYCVVMRGTRVLWLKDGVLLPMNSVRLEIKGSGTLFIKSLEMGDSGQYTCTAVNSFGNVSASAWLNVENVRGVLSNPMMGLSSDRQFPRPHELLVEQPAVQRQQNLVRPPRPTSSLLGEDDDEDNSDLRPNGPHANMHRTGKRPGRKVDWKIDPPLVYRMSASSVMLTWSVPANVSEDSITFFKVQYKMLENADNRRKNSWKTDNTDLFPYRRSHSIDGLQSNERYRFRVIAQLTSGDQVVGNNSAKFFLAAKADLRPPIGSPKITQAHALSPTSIRVVWEYTFDEPAPLQGFVLHYRQLLGDIDSTFSNVTVQGGTTRDHVLDRLLPATHYEIRMEAFNLAGLGSSSNIEQERTMSAGSSYPSLVYANNRGDLETPTEEVPPDVGAADAGQTKEAYNSLDHDLLLMIFASVMGALLVVLLLWIMVRLVRRNKRKKVTKMAAGKFLDTSKQIFFENLQHQKATARPEENGHVTMRDSTGRVYQRTLTQPTSSGNGVSYRTPAIGNEGVFDEDNLSDAESEGADSECERYPQSVRYDHYAAAVLRGARTADDIVVTNSHEYIALQPQQQGYGSLELAAVHSTGGVLEPRMGSYSPRPNHSARRLRHNGDAAQHFHTFKPHHSPQSPGVRSRDRFSEGYASDGQS